MMKYGRNPTQAFVQAADAAYVNKDKMRRLSLAGGEAGVVANVVVLQMDGKLLGGELRRKTPSREPLSAASCIYEQILAMRPKWVFKTHSARHDTLVTG